MFFYSKEGLLFLVQMDHISGELLGDVVDSFYEAGAKNVQILNGVTKKNRPSYVLLVDAAPVFQEPIESVIVRECGSSGWHCIHTTHRHTDVSIVTKDVTVKTAGASFLFSAKGKMIANDTGNIRPEYDSCVELKNLLLQKGNLCVSVREIQNVLSDLFHSSNISELSF